MKTEQIVSWLKDKAARAEHHSYSRMLTMAAQRLEELTAKLKAERHRHDRLQDFEVAEAQELEKVKAERDSMAAALKEAHGCDGCAHRDCTFAEEPCVSCLKDGNYSKWTWKGE